MEQKITMYQRIIELALSGLRNEKKISQEAFKEINTLILKKIREQENETI